MRVLLSSVLALILLAAPTRADIAPLPPEQSVREAVLAYLENTNAHSAEGVAGMFVPGDAARVLDNGRLVTAGREGVLHVIGAELETTPGLRLEVSGDITVVLSPQGDAASADFSYDHHVTGEDGKEVKVFQGVMSMTLFAGSEGWQIVSVHSSANLASMAQ